MDYILTYEKIVTDLEGNQDGTSMVQIISSKEDLDSKIGLFTALDDKFLVEAYDYENNVVHESKFEKIDGAWMVTRSVRTLAVKWEPEPYVISWKLLHLCGLA